MNGLIKKGIASPNWLSRLPSMLLSNRCYLCDVASPEFLCSDCTQDMPTSSRACVCCALPLPEHGASALCGDCLQHPKPFTRTVAAFSYTHPIDFLINRFKHQRHFVCGSQLSQHLCSVLQPAYAHDDWPDTLVPVPLHWLRRWHRGFNQSELISDHLGRFFGIKVSACCRRLRRNPRQQGLKRKERLRNLRRAFTTTRRLDGLHVALVDDVMTTGATVSELAHCLRQAGAARVDVWALARVP